MNEKTIENVISSLIIMGKGMFTIFAVIIVLMLVVMLLTYLSSPKGKKDESDQ
jgi:uncharacterized membrane protein